MVFLDDPVDAAFEGADESIRADGRAENRPFPTGSRGSYTSAVKGKSDDSCLPKVGLG